MAFNLCNLSFTWSSDKSPTYVTKFTYVDLEDCVIDEGSHHSPTENGRLAEEVEFSPEAQLWLSREGFDEDSKHCFLHLACPDPEFAQINGISIVSESRTLEISTEQKGYLTTARGRKTGSKLQGYSQTGTGGSNSATLYTCSCYLDESCPGLSIKFLSLGDRAAFCVMSIRINIVQHGLQASPAKNSLDVTRLKKDIEDMGSTMSERAKDFMTTLEQYEKNKIEKSSGLLASTLAHSSMGTSTNGLSSLMSSILGSGTMKSLTTAGMGSDGDKQGVYDILNSVCGSVANLRVAAVKQQEQTGKNSMDSNEKTSSEVGNEHLKSQSVDLITEKMEQLRLELRGEMVEMKQEMLSKIHDVKSELNIKLDSILSLLQSFSSAKENT